MLLKKIGSFIIIVLAVITFFTCSDGDGDVNDNGYVPGKFKLANSWGVGGRRLYTEGKLLQTAPGTYSTT